MSQAKAIIEKMEKGFPTNTDENSYILKVLKEKVINHELKNISFPEEYEVNLGYDENNAKFIVCENKDEIDVFNQPSSICEYILFMIKDNKFIAVDGGSKRNTWVIPENL